MNRNKNIHRIFYALAFMAAMTLIVMLFGQILVYFKKGTDQINVYEKVKSQFAFHKPSFNWLPDDPNIVGPINKYVRKELQEAYTKSWAATNISLYEQEDMGLKEHYKDSLRLQIEAGLDKSRKHEMERVELNHNIKLHFISFDKQIVSFSDYGVEVLTRLGKNGLNSLVRDTFDFNVIMTLDDGKWRIKNIRRKPSQEKIESQDATLKKIKAKALRGINYYPSKTPWRKFWMQYNDSIVEQDLRVIDTLGFNCVRIFIPFEIFGGADVIEEQLIKMDHLLDAAKEHNLKIMPTLFDFPVGFTLGKYTAYDRHLETILTRYNNHPSILAWDLKNEPDLDFLYHERNDVINWIDFIISRARFYDPNHALTMGWAFDENAMLYADKLDFISFHYYKDLDQLNVVFDSLKANNHENIVVSEYGMTTYNGIFPIGHSEEEQLEYIRGVKRILRENQAGEFLWTLYDFEEAPSDVFGWKPWIKAVQKEFGIMKADGTYKPSAFEIKKSQIKKQ